LFPFWVLQAVELAIAVIFVDISVHVGNGGLLVGSAVVIFVLAVTAKGPLGIVRVCAQGLHLVSAVVVGVVVAVAPVFPTLRPDIEGLIVIEFGAVGLIRMATLTAVTPPGPVRSRQSGASVIDASALVVDPGRSPDAPARMPSTGQQGTTGSAARRAGRTAGAASASGKRAAARYGPVAGAGVTWTLRSAGRAVGRATARQAKGPSAHGDPSGPDRSTPRGG
jgi:hypothetical protein